MTLTRHQTSSGPRWFADGRALTADFSLAGFLALHRDGMKKVLDSTSDDPVESEAVLPPIEANQEIWAAGVTYLRSRDERQAESTTADVYGRVYDADRPELFFKSLGWRSVGNGDKIRTRRDSDWNVPEPELTLIVSRFGDIVGYTAGNDMSSRSIEGENPLYLPQAKTYNGSCAIGPSIVLAGRNELEDISISCSISRGGMEAFRGESHTRQMKRSLSELVGYLTRELSFPDGVFLMTGTGIVPTQGFTLLPGDEVTVTVGELTLVNEVDYNL